MTAKSIHVPMEANSWAVSRSWKRLDELCEGVFDCPHSTPLLTDSGPLVARSQDIRSGVFAAKEAAHVSEETYLSRIERAVPEAGDLLYSREGTYFGIAAEVPPNTRVCLGQRMVLIKPRKDVVSSRFLKYWLNSPILQRHLHGFRDGTVAERLNMPTIRGLPVPQFPLTVQAAIANLLGALDDKCSLNRATNETLEAMAKAIFKDWFVDFGPTRAKMEDIAPYLAAEIWSLFPDKFDDERNPEGWQTRSLDSVAEFLNGLALQKYPAQGGTGLPVIKIAQLRSGNAESGEFASSEIPAQYVVEDGDHLFSWSGSLMHSIWAGGKGALNQHLFKVTPTDCPQWFAYFGVDAHMAEFRAIAASKATTMGHIQRHHLSAATVTFPDEGVLSAADHLILPLFNQMKLNSVEARTLEDLRDLLLPKLMSGEIRLKEAEKAAEAVM